MEKNSCNSQDAEVIRKGPWTMEEDLILMNYIAIHGEGLWNSLAKAAGLKRTGKSCRLRWLNYLHPDVRRGNITPEEHFLIVELHAKWGNRWSKIAKQLPGRTDNEIKNYWRSKIQKRIKEAEVQNPNSEMNDQGTSSSYIHVSSSGLFETYSAPSCPPTIQDFSMMQPPFPPPPPESHEIYWSIEDIWSMHLPDGSQAQ